jgi:hypothetical protein
LAAICSKACNAAVKLCLLFFVFALAHWWTSLFPYRLVAYRLSQLLQFTGDILSEMKSHDTPARI